MPYLRLSTLPLELSVKRILVRELTAAVVQILPHQRPEWTTVHFRPLSPENVATSGQMVIDGRMPDIHLDFTAPALREKDRQRLAGRLTDILQTELRVPADERGRINVRFESYELKDFAVGGRFLSDFGPPSALKLLPFALGLLGGIWFLSRKRVDL